MRNSQRSIKKFRSSKYPVVHSMVHIHADALVRPVMLLRLRCPVLSHFNCHFSMARGSCCLKTGFQSYYQMGLLLFCVHTWDRCNFRKKMHLKSIWKLWWEGNRDAFATRTVLGVLKPCAMAQSHALVHGMRHRSPAPERMWAELAGAVFKQLLQNTFLQTSYIERVTCAGV